MESHDPLDLRALEQDKEARAASSKLDQQNEAEDFKWLMASKRGRRIVWRLLEQAGVFQLSFSPNAMQMAFAEGRRSYGNRTLAQIHALCPEQYTVMVLEQTKT